VSATALAPEGEEGRFWHAFPPMQYNRDICPPERAGAGKPHTHKGGYLVTIPTRGVTGSPYPPGGLPGHHTHQGGYQVTIHTRGVTGSADPPGGLPGDYRVTIPTRGGLPGNPIPTRGGAGKPHTFSPSGAAAVFTEGVTGSQGG